MHRLAQSTPGDGAGRLSVAELEQAMRAADPTAFLVAPRIVRRVIKQNAGVSGLGLRVPHRKTFVIAREQLLLIVDRSELELPAEARLPEQVILIARPTSEMLATARREEALIKYWRQLFHARVHLALDHLTTTGQLTEADIRSRISEIGDSEFAEIRAVLKSEDLLLPPRSDRSVYIEFVAVYLELRYFVPNFLRSYFPSLLDFHHIDELLERDIDAQQLIADTRLPGTIDPPYLSEVPDHERIAWSDRLDEPQHPHPALRRLPARERSDRTATKLIARADHRSKLGNLVRAAILRTRAARYATPEISVAERELARTELIHLTRRLQSALNFSDNEAEEWSRSLHALLENSARGSWTAEARMLYDLQKVCVDHERGIYMLDVWGWASSFGRQSIKRYLPGQRDVMISKHLRSALRRVPAVRLSHRSQSRLAGLLKAAVHRAEATLRARFRPLIDRALDKVKLLPQNPPERVARRKLVDEILDRIVDRGFLSMGELRDAFSRNNLKLPDLAGVREFFLGDPLLQADKQLAATLDGVYRAGEVYRRVPQRISSLAFGTPLGRFLTRYAAIPFGGAYVILEGLQFLVAELHSFFATEPLPEHHVPVHFVSIPAVLCLGVFLLGLLYYQRFRALCFDSVARAGQGARAVLIDFPAWLMRLPVVQQIVASWPFKVFRRYVLKPLVVSAVLVPLASWIFDFDLTLRNCLLTFLAIDFGLNSRIGQNVDEMVTDWVVLTWHRIRIHVIATLFRLIMDVFHTILEAIERVLYTVDEWLRFRAGESRLSATTKAVLGFVWFFVNYVIRFCVTLLIEPQVNPIKHFPVVTVSHKILLPLTPMLIKTLEPPLGTVWANTIGPTAILVAPGAIGFLVWELKENWRLYAANRPTTLRPVRLGHHNETMLQFLRPGFRSGTVPKLYAKLRRASRKAYWTGQWKSVSRHLDGLHHVKLAVRRFTDRELLELLHESRGWNDRSISTGEIHLGCNRILIELYCPEVAEDSMWLAFEEQDGHLVASIHRRGWSDSLSYPRRHALSNALAGFYKMAGVSLVREQIEEGIEPGARGYEITDDHLVVWPQRNAPAHVYQLGEWPPADINAPNPPPVDSRERWVFAATPISWRSWVITWELDQLGGVSKHRVLDALHLLPG